MTLQLAFADPLLASVTDGYLEIGTEGERYVLLSASAAGVMGLAPEAKGRPASWLQEQLGHEQWPRIEQLLQEQDSAVPQELEVDIVAGSGAIKRLLLRGMYMPSGLVWRGVVRLLPDTDAHAPMARLEQASQAALINANCDAIWSFDSQHRLLAGNTAFKKVFEQTFGQAIAVADSLIHPSLPASLKETWQAWYQKTLQGVSFSEQFLISHTNHWFEYHFSPIIQEGVVVGGCCFSKDINAQRLAEGERDALVSATLDPIWSLDAAGRYVVGNRAYQNLHKLRYGREIIKGESFIDPNPTGPNAAATLFWNDIYQNVLANGTFLETEYFNDITSLWYAVSVNPIIIDNVITGVVCHTVDVSAKKREAIEKEALINSTDDWMWSFDTDIRFITGNKAFKDFVVTITGHIIETGYPLLPDNYKIEGQLELWGKNYRRTLAGEAFVEEIHEVHSDSWLLLSFNPILQDGKIVGGTCLTKNVSHLKKAALDRDRLISLLNKTNQELRQFAYMVSHDLRAPVRNLQALVKLFDKSELASEHNQEVLEAFGATANQLNDTLGNLVDLLIAKSKTGVTSKEISLEYMCQKVGGVIKQLILEKGAVITNNFEEDSCVYFNESYLESVFLNLATNAIKYAKPGTAPRLHVTTEKEPNGWVKVRFKDQGRGFDMGVVKGRLFGLNERFHTDSDSKGVGLYLVKQQMEAMGGSITATSKVNEGATFTLRFAPAPENLPAENTGLDLGAVMGLHQ